MFEDKLRRQFTQHMRDAMSADTDEEFNYRLHEVSFSRGGRRRRRASLDALAHPHRSEPHH